MSGVYISYPFCAQKCTYCNFASDVFTRGLEHDYLEALITEIHAHEFAWRPDTVYLGGGTPSRLDTADLERVLSAIPDSTWREATLEVAPGGLARDRILGWLHCGINRVSLGVQSFVGRELSRTGRKHTADIVAGEVAMLRGAGLGNINIDLIAGLPGQTMASWRESLDWIERLAPPHVSVYMLEVDEDSRLGQEVLLNGKRYGAPEIPSDELIVELYETAVEELRRVGLHRYEISNFARPGFESLHNLKYWRLEPYIGFGVDAHSFDGGVRWQNGESPAGYIERIRLGQSVRISTTRANRPEEHFFVGLRLSEGIEPTPDEWVRYDAPIQRFLTEGLLTSEAGKLCLTNRGVLLSNEVFAEFI